MRQPEFELARRVLDRIGSPLERMQSAGELDYRMRQATGIARKMIDYGRTKEGESVGMVKIGEGHERPVHDPALRLAEAARANPHSPR